MKGKIAVLALTGLIFLGMTTSHALAANSFNFLGETSWAITINESFPSPPPPFAITMTGAISRLAPNYYLFQGSVVPPQEAQDNPIFLSGSGNILNGKLVLTLNATQLHPGDNRDTSILQVVLDPSDLSGTFYEVGHDYNRGEQKFMDRFTAGTIGPANPFIPLNTTIVPQSMLLLQ
jgi:hypothetical protein